MSSSLGVTHQQCSSKFYKDKQQNIGHPHNILKSKENLFKSKCNRTLKNKLKKYRLRKDGKEDEDIIDVSKTLISSLKIKSPNGQEAGLPFDRIELEDNLPRNYLFKMVRKRNDTLKTATEGTPNIVDSKCNSPTSEAECTESKHTDAFKLLMDSRNKSIGGNSPGKEKNIHIVDESEQMQKKELKAKRHLILQQMAQKKGSEKNQENEEIIDDCIKKKLEKRAERLKEMITLNVSKKENKITRKNGENKDKSKLNNVNLKIKEKVTIVKSSKLQLFNFLSEDENSVIESHDCKSMTNEDTEFLKKLGPSIRKKENMLSYFQKLEKQDTSCSGPEIEINDNNNRESSIIKVKFVAKNKSRKTEVKLVKDTKVLFENADSNSVDISFSTPDEVSNKLNINSTPARKRKRDKTYISVSKKEENVQVQDENISSRPKRSTKKPIKYSDDILLSSSDDESIFSPIKKKNINKELEFKDESQNDVIIVSKNRSKNCIKSKIKSNKSELKSQKTKKEMNGESKKPVKLAPIFSSKSKLTPLEQAAKESFLKSGVPEKLKIKLKESTNVVTWNQFYVTVHVQQNDNEEFKFKETDIVHLKNSELFGTEDSVLTTIDYGDKIYSQLLNLTVEKNDDFKFSVKHKPEDLLSYMKKSYSKFPVYRTFHSLKTKSRTVIMDTNMTELDNSIEIVKDIVDFTNDYPDKLSWNEKYKAMSSKQIIGNFDSVKELKRWLESWNDNQKNIKAKNDDSDLSDFCFSDSDTNSRDPFKHTNNVLIISGKPGTGKTSSVYAVAAELAIKVIEVNASSKRTGKIMLQDLQEATQSHKVNRANNKKDSSQNSQTSQENCMSSKIFKKRGRPKKTYERKSKCIESKDVELNSLSQQSQSSSQENSKTESSLILIDDADIVFEQDDGFCSAVSQLINYSKRPVILITSSLSCPHLQKYISCGKIIKMNPLVPRMLGTWLDIMCLADTNTCVPGFGCKMLDYFRGDIRKTIFFLQFYMISNKHLNEIDDGSQEADFKANIDDENSSMSWVDHNSEDITKEVYDKDIRSIIDRQMITLDSYNFDLFNIWWNVPNQFNSENHRMDIERDGNTSISLEDASRILDDMSFVDYIDMNAGRANITSKPWMSFQSPSTIEKENMDCYDLVNEINRDISKEIIGLSTSVLQNWEKTPKILPSMSTQRIRNKIVSQHNTLSKYLNPSSTLDRRALALDYWSTCRTICRLEKNKTDSNLKRNNRFCHYLKSLNISCKNDNFDDLCEGLS